MHTESQKLLAEIEAFLRDRAAAGKPMAETTFGRKAGRDSAFVQSLRRGGRCWPETAERIRQYI